MCTRSPPTIGSTRSKSSNSPGKPQSSSPTASATAKTSRRLASSSANSKIQTTKNSMKIQLSRKLKQVGGTLVTVLVICAILSLSVGYYLSLVEQQGVLSARSQTWNMAMTISEAGLEEGLQQLNSNAGHLTTDGWFYDGTLYWRTNTMPDNSSYTVNIDYHDPSAPIVIARAYLNPSVQSSLFAAIGANTASKTVTRAIRVKA